MKDFLNPFTGKPATKEDNRSNFSDKQMKEAAQILSSLKQAVLEKRFSDNQLWEMVNGFGWLLQGILNNLQYSDLPPEKTQPLKEEIEDILNSISEGEAVEKWILRVARILP